MGGDGRFPEVCLNPRVSIHAPRVGGDPSRHAHRFAAEGFQSTPPAWGATRPLKDGCRTDGVSIHAPRVGGDDPGYEMNATWQMFQSTPPAWGATFLRPDRRRRASCFNPRPPRGGRPSDCSYTVSSQTFQSTPPAWGATVTTVNKYGEEVFQSTPPAWGATLQLLHRVQPFAVSIHAPRVGGDHVVVEIGKGHLCFNPRPPRGGRRTASRQSSD